VIEIRTETPDDVQGIRVVNERAFGGPRRVRSSTCFVLPTRLWFRLSPCIKGASSDTFSFLP